MDIQTLMASTVHDVKNSLGLIENQLSKVICRLDEKDVESAEEIRRIQLECARINNGMVHMLGLYSMEAGQFLPTFEEVMVLDVVDDAISRHTAVLNALGIQIEVIDDLGGLWYMDANLIEGLLANVLTNSIRYTRTSLTFEIAEREGWLNIRIIDDGDGFPDSMLSMLDKPETLCFHSGATGLGIYFCQQIAHLHFDGKRRGNIALSNRVDPVGAVFDLWLP